MSLDLTIQNRQRTRAINSRYLEQIITTLLSDLLDVKQVELGVTLVAASEMTRLNETFLKHEGSTDVITFDYREPGTSRLKPGSVIRGEILVCVQEAILQARRFRATWQQEVIRYVVHGVLHLLGYDDGRVADRRKMKREETRLLHLIVSRFALSQLARKTKLAR